ncbi:unnamed protein product [Peronospora destructor]|uniref:Endonuclease/exonuclease/phosphatase domain-containing protein n=1 Tax=Peronospora destructor TaxID=86335 RepID=A0AAV0SXV1_9STRA|nr:unnamed protein product [Peronospora destructor]
MLNRCELFIDGIGIPYHEPLIFAGDFNVDNHTFGGEVAYLMNLLEAHEPRQIGKQIFTSDPHTNVLVGRDGAAVSNKCSAQYVQSWGPPKNGVFYPSLLTRTTCGIHTELGRDNRLVLGQQKSMCYCPCCPLEWLDYVLYGKAPYQQPITVPTLEAYVNQVSSFTVNWTVPKESMRMALIDLSDHYPVLGKFEFSVTRGKGKDDDPLTYHLDGCSRDDDCELHRFHCYCTGPNCYFKGIKVNGSTFNPESPVNSKCLYQETSFRCLCGPT